MVVMVVLAIASEPSSMRNETAKGSVQTLDFGDVEERTEVSRGIVDRYCQPRANYDAKSQLLQCSDGVDQSTITCLFRLNGVEKSVGAGNSNGNALIDELKVLEIRVTELLSESS